MPQPAVIVARPVPMGSWLIDRDVLHVPDRDGGTFHLFCERHGWASIEYASLEDVRACCHCPDCDREIDPGYARFIALNRRGVWRR